MCSAFLALLYTLALFLLTTASPLSRTNAASYNGRNVIGQRQSADASDANPAAAIAATIAKAIALQTSTTIDPRVFQEGFLNNGQNPPVDGKSPSLTSENNFINFCARTLPQTPLTNGKQIPGGSCNGAPMGLIPSTKHMPSAKFVNPPNLATIRANEDFDIVLNLRNLDAGHFTNAQETYFSAPQQLNAQGEIIGHTHVVIEALPSLTSTEASDPNEFFFFKGINSPLVDGAVSTPVTGGVPEGAYRMCSQNAAANHQPVVVPVAQHGSVDDCVYFTAV